MAKTIVLVKTELRRYAVRHDDISAIRMLASPADLEAIGTPERPSIPVELGTLLDPQDCTKLARRRGMVVLMRRRPIVFMVDLVDDFLENPEVLPLPELLRGKLNQPWATGALLIDQDVVLVLDLRAIARSILVQQREG